MARHQTRGSRQGEEVRARSERSERGRAGVSALPARHRPVPREPAFFRQRVAGGRSGVSGQGLTGRARRWVEVRRSGLPVPAPPAVAQRPKSATFEPTRLGSPDAGRAERRASAQPEAPPQRDERREARERGEDQIEAGRGFRARRTDQPRDDERAESAEDRHRDVIRERHAGRARRNRKDLRKQARQRGEIAGHQEREHDLHGDQRAERRMRGEPRERRVDQHEDRERGHAHRPHAAVAIGPVPDHRRETHLDHADDENRGERRGRRELQLLHAVGRHEQHEVSRDGAEHDRADRRGKPPLVRGERVAQRVRGGRRREEFGRLVDFRTNVVRDGPEQQPEAERHAPAPCRHLRAREPRVERRAEDRREECREPLARDLPAREETAPPGHVLGEKRGRAAEFAARGEALHQPRADEHDGRRDPDRRVGRQHRDDERARHHQQDRQRERGLAAVAVRVCAEHDRAERPHEERHAERAERQQQRHRVVAGGKEQPRDRDREETVDDEIEPFERVADRRGDDGAPHARGDGIGRGRSRVGCVHGVS
ncbi:hypothetical protein BURPS1710b_3375 [Burkholderia pseudomallei 1710b]|uniref:Uncharacterized protein n=1 Tax=Burkholderia pseudomallei (strain 1710b) TaxID=320372 RepID=Q3JNV7_BURP1|nr:hypothetical protein BURPS1710b_3375 [Burkholderia pseudomallei 1710b]